jgi:hypothetical protein
MIARSVAACAIAAAVTACRSHDQAERPLRGSNRHIRLSPAQSSVDANLRFEDAALPAGRAAARFRQRVFVEGEAARAASGGHDDDAVAGGAGGADHVPQRVLDVGARKPEFPREARDRSRLVRQIREKILAERHRMAGMKTSKIYTGGHR